MMIVEQSVEYELAGETEVLGENCPSATLSTTNPTWTDQGSKPGRRDGKPATNHLSYGTACSTHLKHSATLAMIDLFIYSTAQTV
jgi:hypothetical protein